MADPGAEGRIRELKRRITQDPTSPLFMALAEEYRAAGHLPEAVRILEKGVNTYAGYVSARVALARAYLEVGRTEESITMFSRALASDPGNLVAARSLAEIHLSRGDRIEGIKKYKLYRALSGDRSVDEIIVKIGAELTGSPEAPKEPPPQGRVLADLYMAQGHPEEAQAIYEELAQADPSDAELERLRQAAAARGSVQEPPAPLQSEPDLTRRQARVERLKRWLAVIQAG
jgi:tetratricopeptide (TPR) repeat protein